MYRNALINKGIRIWYIESATYNFSVNISAGLVNALAIKLLGYGPLELGLLTALRIIAIGLSQLPAALLISYYREKRKLLWLIFGAINRLGWAAMPVALLFPRSEGLALLSAMNFAVQFAGGIAGVAASDTLGDMIPPSYSATAFSKANQINYLSIAVANGLAIAIFASPLGVVDKYTYAYSLSFGVATLSTALLYLIPDPGVSASARGYPIAVNVFEVVKRRELSNYLKVISIFNFAVNIPAPFWDLLVMDATGGNEVFVIAKNFASLVAKVPSARLWKSYMIKHGTKKTIVIGLAGTSVVPVLYADIVSPLELIGVEVYSGVVWASVDLATTIYNIYLPPSAVRPLFLSSVGITSNVMAGIASAIGTAAVAATGNIATALFASSVLRGVTAAIATKSLPELAEIRDSSGNSK